LTLILSFVCALPIFGQSPDKVIPPSPNASSLGKYGEIPVGTYTGTPQIGLPIGEAKGKQLSVPVSLSYHASGIKVDDIASQVGLGWSLNAGGVITRTIKGQPDESTWGFANYTFNPQNDANLESALLNLIDTEPDAFFFNVNGYSGKFYLDKAGNNKVVRLIPYQDIKLEFIDETASNTSRWLMTTPDGSKYFFNTPEYNNTNLDNGGIRADITSWYLTKIEGLTGDIANFSYLQGESINYRTAISETLLTPAINNVSTCYVDMQAHYPIAKVGQWSFPTSEGVLNSTNTGLSLNSPIVQTNSIYIDEILTFHNKIKFTYTNDRQDFATGALALQKVTISNKNYTTGTFVAVKKINFSYDYFGATEGLTPFGDDRNLKRLKLSKLTEIGIAADGIETILPANEFEYYEDENTNLPPRLSKKQDHWGYANKNPHNWLIPRKLDDPKLYNKGDRSTDEIRCMAGTIKRIKYPTGGFTEFEFEPHKVVNSPELMALSTSQFVNMYESAIADFSYTNNPNTHSIIVDIPITQVVDIDYALSLGTLGAPEYFGYVKIDKIDANGNLIANILDFGNGAPATNNVQNPMGILKTTRTLSAGKYKLTAHAQRQEIGSPERSTIFIRYYKTSLSQTAIPINVPIGGVRVKRVKTYESANSQPIIKRYEYNKFDNSVQSSGELISLPKYTYELKFATICRGGTIQTPIILYECGDECLVNGLISASKVPLGASQGSHVVYTNVSIMNGENGEGGKSNITYSYYPDILNYAIPFTQHDSYDWKRGNIEQQIDYKKVNNNYIEVKKTTNNYIYGRYGGAGANSVNSSYQTGYVVALDYPNRVTRPTGLSSVTKINQYHIFAPWVSLESSTVIQDGVTSVTTNTYDEANGRHAQAKTVRTQNSNGQEIRTETLYNKDLPTSTDAGIALCNQLSMLVPVEQKSYSNTTLLIGGSKNKYEPITVNGKSIPLQTQWISFLKNSGTEQVQATVTYHPDGNLKTVLKKGFWIAKNYVWENGLPKSETFGGLTSTVTYRANSTAIESITDENGFKTTFDYDVFLRLKESKNYFFDNTLRSTTANTYNYRPATVLAADVNKKAFNNYVSSKTTFDGLTDELITTQFMDGLGRPIEVMKEKYTPKVAPHPNDAWQQKNYITYDALGRQDKGYQPFESSTLDVETPPSGTPFVYPKYEDSPLSRPIRQYAEDGKYVEMAYGANALNEVRYFSVNAAGEVQTAPTFYAINTLYKTTITNENGTTTPNGNVNKTDVFKDILGRVILTRKYLDNTEAGKIDTYNVYDDYGNLVMVIPPGAIDAGNNAIPNLVFTYKYNNKNLLCEKKIPGADVQKFYYDNRDLLTLSQDGNMRAANPMRYLGTGYDELGRQVRIGLIETANPESDLAAWTFNWVRVNPAAELVPIMSFIDNNFVPNTNLPRAMSVLSIGNINTASGDRRSMYREVAYNAKREKEWTCPEYLRTNNCDDWVWNADGTLKSGNKYNNGPNGYQMFYRYSNEYDHARRSKSMKHQLWSGSYLGPDMELTNLTYNYKDQVTQKDIGKRAGQPYALQSIDYQYNQRGWLTAINQMPLSSYSQGIPQGGSPVLSLYGGAPTFNIQNGEGSVDLFSEIIRYNNPDTYISNLGTPQYNGNISQVQWQVAGRERQAYTYKYDALDRLLEGEYTDIHDMEGPQMVGQTPYSTDNKFGEKLTYDVRGNITSLVRNGMIAPGFNAGSVVTGTFGQIDNLSYIYGDSNRIKRIMDGANATKGFKYRATDADRDYDYDKNGNLVADRNKGITRIVYNYMNLPERIEWFNPTNPYKPVIEFVYDATGMKLRKTATLYNQNLTTFISQEVTDYMDGFEYKNNTIERIHHAEGVITQRAKRDGESTEFVGAGGLVWQYEYTLKDHLGNTRVTFADIDGNRTIEPNTEINQINHYYPFGLNMEGNWNGASADAKNKYQYNGKELQTDFGLNWNDYGARNYDAERVVWTTIDPLAEKHFDFTGYNYVLNNPIKFIDPFGLDTVPANSQKFTEMTGPNTSTEVTIDGLPPLLGQKNKEYRYKPIFTDTGGTIEDPTGGVISDAKQLIEYYEMLMGGGALIGSLKVIGKKAFKTFTKETLEEVVEYGKARNEALEWLTEKGFSAEKVNIGKLGDTKGRGIGMTTKDGSIGFRVEYDEKNGAHINVFAGKEKGPHYTFKASPETVKELQKLFDAVIHKGTNR
jgi:RHS repeat-associated protein